MRTESWTIYVTGAVNRPGIVEVPADSQVVDAVNACGGALPTADMDSVNMAQKLKDGIQLRVPKKDGSTVPAPEGGTSGKAGKGQSSGLVNINTADEKTLDSLPGIGDAKYEKLKDHVTV